MEVEIEKHLFAIYNSEVPRLNSLQTYRFGEDKVEFNVLPKGLAHLHEVLWACPLVFSVLTLDDLLWLLSATLNDQHIFIVSRNYSVMTAIV
jgi:hypothetical protein